jgi:hypothetical protein
MVSGGLRGLLASVAFLLMIWETNFIEIFFGIFPIPSLTAELSPIIKGFFAAPDPGIIVEATASSENFAASVWLFNAGIVGPVD